MKIIENKFFLIKLQGNGFVITVDGNITLELQKGSAVLPVKSLMCFPERRWTWQN